MEILQNVQNLKLELIVSIANTIYIWILLVLYIWTLSSQEPCLVYYFTIHILEYGAFIVSVTF